jgi:hypothetical protein
MVDKDILSEELAEKLNFECETNRVLAKTIRKLHEMSLLEDMLRFFDNDEDKEKFLKWLSERSNLDSFLRNMENDPFSAIKSYLIGQGTFWNEANSGPLTEVEKSISFT